MADPGKLDIYFALCSSFRLGDELKMMCLPLCCCVMVCLLVVCSLYSVPLWVAPLLHAASRLRRDPARRRKAYRLIQRTLLHHGVGCEKRHKPTYVYPAEVKQLIRAAFPQQICNFTDPQHENVVSLSLDDLRGLS